MTRTLISNVKLVLALADNVSLALNRRGFAAVATQSGVTASGGVLNTRSSVMKAGEGSKKDSEINPWVPDPVTGYYRPANHADQIDVAELRQALLNNNKRQN